MVLAVRVYLKKPEILLLEEDLTVIDNFKKFSTRNNFW